MHQTVIMIKHATPITVMAKPFLRIEMSNQNVLRRLNIRELPAACQRYTVAPRRFRPIERFVRAQDELFARGISIGNQGRGAHRDDKTLTSQRSRVLDS